MFIDRYRVKASLKKYEGGGDIRTAFDLNHGDISIFVEAVK